MQYLINHYQAAFEIQPNLQNRMLTIDEDRQLTQKANQPLSKHE